MQQYEMKSRTIPLDNTWDVIVIGGGPAGCTAATAAAREGARTLLVESTGCLGGMGTAALVPAWCPFSDQEKVIYRGLAEKVFESAKKHMAHVNQDATEWVPIDAELLKRVYDDMVLASGAEVLFHTSLCAAETDEKGGVSTVILSNKAGLSAYGAKVYIDCTGDADLAAWAGAAFIKGEQNGGALQPATHCFILSNVDQYAYMNGPVLHGENPLSPIYDILESGKYPLIPDAHICNNLVGPGTVGFNAGHIWNVDNTDPLSVSKALVQGRKMAAAFKDALAEMYPQAFASSFLVNTGTLMGIRETRRIVGDYMLTVEDYMSRRSFEDEICRNSYFIDCHMSEEESRSTLRDNGAQQGSYARYGTGESHGIPYRCLTPKGLTNVLVAGRSISCDRAVNGSIRVMPVCLAMGEAAGIAGAMAAEMPEADIHTVNTERLRNRLKEEGAYLPEV